MYGYPVAWPPAFTPEPADLAALRRLCEEVRDDFTAQWNDALHQLDPEAAPSADTFAETGDVLLLNYPAALHDESRTRLLPPHAFLGSAVREEPVDDEVQTWLSADNRPVVYVSFGSFLSVRGDVLARVAAALRGLDVRAAIATGSTPRHELGELPSSWLVRDFLPQVTLLRHAALAVSHGGNNSVTEAMTAAVPLLLLPFSTDQFAGAAAVEAAGFGAALDPNTASVEKLRTAASGLLTLSGEARGRLERLSASLTDCPGPGGRTRPCIGCPSEDRGYCRADLSRKRPVVWGRLRLILSSISSAGLVQTNGWQRVVQLVMNSRILIIRSRTEGKAPRRMACRSMMLNQTSTRFSHEPDVGVKVELTRGFAASQSRIPTRLWVP